MRLSSFTSIRLDGHFLRGKLKHPTTTHRCQALANSPPSGYDQSARHKDVVACWRTVNRHKGHEPARTGVDISPGFFLPAC